MIKIDRSSTIGETFFRCAAAWEKQPFLAVPTNPTRHYYPYGFEISYTAAAAQVHSLMEIYACAGYGVGHRVGLLIENRPEHLLHKLAMNGLGICCVPINADLRPAEMAYVVDHARIDLLLVTEELINPLHAALEIATHQPVVATFSTAIDLLPPACVPAISTTPEPESPASILYTSGTTGRPKGCVLSHAYELEVGSWYATIGGLVTFQEGEDRLYNPLPLFHVNSSVLSFFCVMLHGNCQIQTDRFSPSRWWGEIRESGATVVHYLGVIVPLLLDQKPGPQDRDHRIRFAIGAGVDPQRHFEFEQRFGFPLIEVWGMTEMVRLIVDSEPPRQVGTRAFGRQRPGLQVRIVDHFDDDLPDGTPGEMLVRHSEASPRKGFFSEYLGDPDATEQAWRGGWFHTGDIVRRDLDGLLHFIERSKNIIRRSGENIAAAEVESILQTHPLVLQAVVLPVTDEVREEEVLACVVLHDNALNEVQVAIQNIFEYCAAEMAYHKTPGWFWVTDRLPTTSTQKIQKHQIFEPGVDPRTLPGMIDLRARKRRSSQLQYARSRSSP